MHVYQIKLTKSYPLQVKYRFRVSWPLLLGPRGVQAMFDAKLMLEILSLLLHHLHIYHALCSLATFGSARQTLIERKTYFAVLSILQKCHNQVAVYSRLLHKNGAHPHPPLSSMG